MRLSPLLIGLVFLGRLLGARSPAAEVPAEVRTFNASGVIVELPADKQSVVIRHHAISNYMAAMTMPFPVKNFAELDGLQAGDKITFQLHVTDDDSWVDHLIRRGTAALPPPAVKHSAAAAPPHPQHPLLHYEFTNELGQPVSLGDFRGQALAITFFYTRCPIPNYCPRLSKNFEEASRKLAAMTNAPSNWHFLSVSFDPRFDTPATLRAYGQNYQYDPAHWSFLTGPADKINELARACGVTTSDDGSIIQHNFRTLIIDASGHLQMVFPTSGDLSDKIVNQILQAAKTTSPPVAQSKS
jgi:protein SCO1/2